MTIRKPVGDRGAEPRDHTYPHTDQTGSYHQPPVCQGVSHALTAATVKVVELHFEIEDPDATRDISSGIANKPMVTGMRFNPSIRVRFPKVNLGIPLTR